MSKQLYGVDVSEWNGKPNWSQAAKTKQFMITRVGFGYPQPDQMDSEAARNVLEASKAGMKAGLYWYSYPSNTASKAKEEARGLCDFADKYKQHISLPLYIDLEEVKSESKAFVRKYVTDFCEYVKSRGYTPGVYYNFDYEKRFYGADFWAAHPDYVRWLSYPDSGGLTPAERKGVSMWQDSWVGSVPGISGDVDTDIIFDDTPEPPKPKPEPQLPPWLIAGLLKMKQDYEREHHMKGKVKDR